MTTMSTADILAHGLPSDASGVQWEGGWVGCRAHIEDHSWAGQVDETDTDTGRVVYGPVACNMCAEREAGR